PPAGRLLGPPAARAARQAGRRAVQLPPGDQERVGVPPHEVEEEADRSRRRVRRPRRAAPDLAQRAPQVGRDLADDRQPELVEAAEVPVERVRVKPGLATELAHAEGGEAPLPCARAERGPDEPSLPPCPRRRRGHAPGSTT